MEPSEWTSLDYFYDYYCESEQSIISTLISVTPIYPTAEEKELSFLSSNFEI